MACCLSASRLSAPFQSLSFSLRSVLFPPLNARPIVVLPPTAYLTPQKYAAQWREARSSKSTEFITAPPWSLCMLAGRYNDNYPKPQHQDIIYIGYSTAWRMRRAAGYIANIRYETSGKNVNRPASAQAVIKLHWKDEHTGEMAHVFARTTAYASSYGHRLISPCSFGHIALGDIISGVIETPKSDQCSTNMISWGVPEMAMLLRAHGPMVPEWHGIFPEPKIFADLPQLGGSNFRRCPTLSAMCSLRLE